MHGGMLVTIWLVLAAGSALAQGGHCGGCTGHSPRIADDVESRYRWKRTQGAQSCHIDGELAGLGLHLQAGDLSDEQLSGIEAVLDGALARIDDALAGVVAEDYRFAPHDCEGDCGEAQYEPEHGWAEGNRFRWERGSNGDGAYTCHYHGDGMRLGLHLGSAELPAETEDELQGILEEVSARLGAVLSN